MNCYVHAKEGTREAAVAVCKICGMGVCLEHAVERNALKVQSVGLAGYPDRSMLILCKRDADAVAE